MGYERQIASAKRAIAAKGELCQWKKPAAADPDAQPWRDVREGDPPELPDVRIAWFPPGLQTQTFLAALGVEGEVPEGYEMGLMSGDVAFEPALADAIIRSNGDPVTVCKVDRLAPDGTPILFTVWVAR